MTFKTCFGVLFLMHHLSGVVNRHWDVQVGEFSIIGALNLAAVALLILSLGVPAFLRQLARVRHMYVALVGIYVFGCFPSILLHFDVRGLVSFATNFITVISVYYLAQVFWAQLKQPEITIARILKVFFVYTTVVGLLHALEGGFSFEFAREKSHEFSFYIFEYPHSAGIVIAALLPLYYSQILAGRIHRSHLVVVYLGLPVALLFSGARIAILTYAISLSLSLVYAHARSARGAALAIVLLLSGMTAFLNSPVYDSLVEISETPLDTYLSESDQYSINSFHTRIKVWTFMAAQTIINDRLLGGAGWRAWTLQYQKNEGISSAQSDYLTIFFDTGLTGLIGFLLYRMLGIWVLLRDGIKGRPEPVYLAIGATAGIFLGSFSETVEGYASTSWLFPIFLSLSHYYRRTVQHNGTRVALTNILFIVGDAEQDKRGKII